MTDRRKDRRWPGIGRTGAAALLAAAAVAGCSSGSSDQPANVEIRGTDPGTGGVVAPGPDTAPTGAPSNGVAGTGAPNAAGIVSYDGYQTVVARDGDTVADLAGRVDLSASELAAYNGLTPSHQMLAGDELVLPPRPGGYGAVTGGTEVAAAPATSATDLPVAGGPIEQAPLEEYRGVCMVSLDHRAESSTFAVALVPKDGEPVPVREFEGSDEAETFIADMLEATGLPRIRADRTDDEA